MDTDRFAFLEAGQDDFPFYNGRPVKLSGRQWLLVLLSVIAAFFLIVTPFRFFLTPFGQFIPAILFPVIPIAALAHVSSGHWASIFRKVRWRDVLWMIVFAILNLIITILIGLLVMKTHGASSNLAVSGIITLDSPGKFLFYLKTIPSLFGEEVISVLPFLGLLTLFYSSLHLSRINSVILAWLFTAFLFGIAHLSMYNWDILQCVVVIGSARLVLLLPYIMTKNILVSTGAHIINDWIIFSITILGHMIALQQQ